MKMVKNQEYEIEILDIDKSGGGIGRVDNMAVFIPNAVTEDIVNTKIIKLAKNYAIGKLINIVKPSQYRIEGKCNSADKCGGCSVQHIDYDFQLKYKQKQVKDCLERIGKIQNVNVQPTVGMDNPLHYRNKAQYPIRKVGDKCHIGFYALKTHNVVNINQCLIDDVRNAQIINIVRNFLESKNISIYNEETHKGLIRHLVIRTSRKEILVCLVINGKTIPYIEDLIQNLKKVSDIVGIVLNHNKEKGNVILSEKNTIAYGRDYITETICGLKFKISLLSFFQVNIIQTEALYSIVKDLADLKGTENVLDAYCGIGTIALCLADKAKKVVGVEIVKQAVINAKENAKINSIDNVQFVLGKAEDLLLDEKYDLIVLDPPRKGCDLEFLNKITNNAPPKIIYVSCDPATLARDVKFISEKGYKVNSVQPVDMFPYTSHVETVVLMSK
ncbi:MAG: 23S rRNA (uracil-5-)-methyltransferase RumA [Candidatus Epulonipiscioides saccharophilum]|nr:MAG: 23S rRNA (uracil-5-)-methyltransferase RumA [Epulopiscium sp. AS2M-Bin001]